MIISDLFQEDLHEAVTSAIVACLVTAPASWSRGVRYMAEEKTVPSRAA